MNKANASYMQNKFNYRLKKTQNDNESMSYITDALTGVLKNDYDDKIILAERLTKYFKK